MWLSFKFQLSAAPTGHVIEALRDLGKSKIHPREATKAWRQSRCIALSSRYIGLYCQHHNLATLPLVQTRYHLYTILVCPRGGLEGCGKFPPLGFDPQTVHQRAVRYTNCVIPKY